MEWMQFLILIITLGGLFLWNRTESRNDHRHAENRVNAQIEAIRQDIREFHSEFHKETKDFHGRLCAIEEKNKKNKSLN